MKKSSFIKVILKLEFFISSYFILAEPLTLTDDSNSNRETLTNAKKPLIEKKTCHISTFAPFFKLV
jgi:hypothetical protein